MMQAHGYAYLIADQDDRNGTPIPSLVGRVAPPLFLKERSFFGPHWKVISSPPADGKKPFLKWMDLVHLLEKTADEHPSSTHRSLVSSTPTESKVGGIYATRNKIEIKRNSNFFWEPLGPTMISRFSFPGTNDPTILIANHKRISNFSVPSSLMPYQRGNARYRTKVRNPRMSEMMSAPLRRQSILIHQSVSSPEDPSPTELLSSIQAYKSLAK